ncbi:MAG: HAMP domain-containing sensor histidine kinase [Spirochaetia bacterium]|nr:HAMP domain-containing sensor histidine kinase [Spirochaetia bacterium]
MKFKKQVALLLFSSILLILFASLFTARSVFTSIITNQEKDNLEKAALYLDSSQSLDYNNLLTFSQINQFRVTVINLDGEVVFDSEKDINLMDNHFYREEIKAAKIDNIGFSYRNSKTTKVETLYCAIKSNNKDLYIRVAAPISNFSFLNSTFISKIIPIILIIILLLSIALFFILRYLFIPIESLVEVSKGYAKGELDVRTQITSPSEIKDLSETMNSMAQELQKIIKNLEREKNEYALVLQTLQEGVIFLNNKKEIVLCNKATVSILGKAIKKNMVLRDIISDIDLNNQINDALNNFEKSEIELCFYDNYTAEMAHIYGKGKEKNLKIRITAMIQNDNCEGILLTINDTTEVHRLENIRKDFVSNVSHELKTPLTSIGGFTELLLNNDLDKEKAIEFYQDIYLNYKNMKAIIEDLLLLSSLEKEKSKPIMQEIPIVSIIDSVIKTTKPLADKKNIIIKKNIINDLMVYCNEGLLKQAIINLVVNAINYSPDNSKVEIKISEKKYEIIIKIKDYGIGIPESDINRIFERFYRVDKNRSRDSGGTGLGLSIVKHIALLHSGSIEVKSKENKGSTFILTLSKTHNVLTSLYKKSDLMYKA